VFLFYFVSGAAKSAPITADRVLSRLEHISLQDSGGSSSSSSSSSSSTSSATKGKVDDDEDDDEEEDEADDVQPTLSVLEDEDLAIFEAQCRKKGKGKGVKKAVLPRPASNRKAGAAAKTKMAEKPLTKKQKNDALPLTAVVDTIVVTSGRRRVGLVAG
jgi:U3 small nucleolar RNA-associated protein 14